MLDWISGLSTSIDIPTYKHVHVVPYHGSHSNHSTAIVIKGNTTVVITISILVSVSCIQSTNLYEEDTVVVGITMNVMSAC